MSLRRFVNLVVLERKRQIYSNRSRSWIYKRWSCFHIPRTCLSFQPKPCPDAIDHYCFGVSENKIVFDPEEDGAGSVYVMESVPTPLRDNRGQFEAFSSTRSRRRPSFSSLATTSPPPISSYAVLGGGSHLCISATGLGTYCFDTVSKEWSHVGDWMLPISGKAEYVPDLGLWFGMSRKDRPLSSALNGQQPELRCKWESRFPPTWISFESCEMVNLGSYPAGSSPKTPSKPWCPTPTVGANQYFCCVVLSGLELKPGNDQPQLIFHKSKIVISGDAYSVIKYALNN